MNNPNSAEEAAQAAAQAEIENRKRVARVLSEFNIHTEAEKAEIARASTENPLDALEEMQNPMSIDLGLPDGESKADPLRRSGSTALAGILQNRLAAAADDPWKRVVVGLGLVEATREHREVYEELFFSDDPLELDISMQVGLRKIVVRCRTLTPGERELVARAAKRALEDNELLKTAGQALVNEYVLRASVIAQVTRFGEETWPAGNGILDNRSEADVENLAELCRSFFDDMPRRKFALIAKAVHTFDVICDILDDAAVNADFTDPARFA